MRYDGDTPPWEMRHIEGRGFCAFATRRFAAFQFICSEFPVFWVHGHHPFNEHQINEINDKLDRLEKADRDAFHDMANEFREDHEPSVGIVMTNCFDMTNSIYGESCAMYLALARLNHSCVPNVQQTHYPDTTEEFLYASRDIEIGDEICDCYIDLCAEKYERQRSLMDVYRFHCGCPGCSLSCTEAQQEDDKVRVRAGAVGDSVIALIEDGMLDDALHTAKSVASLLENELYKKWSIRYLAETYLHVYQIASVLEYFNLATEYLMKAHKLNVSLQGPNSPDSRSTAKLIRMNQK